jgi:DNA invertase Pin-like site-specific DNA recombinase
MSPRRNDAAVPMPAQRSQEKIRPPEGIDLTGGKGIIPSRRPMRRRQDRGLPSQSDLVKLAKAYLHQQYQHWPELAAQQDLPPNTLEQAEEMAATYTLRFRSGEIIYPEPKGRGWSGIGACYLRYSCENSNPRSLDDQLSHILKAARAASHFIPWDYVLADSSISGTIAVRRGYLLVKEVMRASPKHSASVLYVYDMSRASRDIIESHKLARLLRSMRKGLIGVADGFDLNSPQADIQLMAMSMFSDMYVKNVRQRCGVGMRGAVRRGTSIGTLHLRRVRLPVAVPKFKRPSRTS